LLDFRKLESVTELALACGDMVFISGRNCQSFDKYAEEKEINLKFNSLKKEITNFDTDNWVKS